MKIEVIHAVKFEGEIYKNIEQVEEVIRNRLLNIYCNEIGSYDLPRVMRSLVNCKKNREEFIKILNGSLDDLIEMLTNKK